MPAREGVAVDESRAGAAASGGVTTGVRVLGVLPGRGEPPLSPRPRRRACRLPVLSAGVAVVLCRSGDVFTEVDGEELDGEAHAFPVRRLAVPVGSLREERGGGVAEGEEDEREEMGVAEGAV